MECKVQNDLVGFYYDTGFSFVFDLVLKLGLQNKFFCFFSLIIVLINNDEFRVDKFIFILSVTAKLHANFFGPKIQCKRIVLNPIDAISNYQSVQSISNVQLVDLIVSLLIIKHPNKYSTFFVHFIGRNKKLSLVTYFSEGAEGYYY